MCKLKAKDKISWYNFCLESASQDFKEDEHNEIGTVYDFLVEPSSINIHQYSIVKTNTK